MKVYHELKIKQQFAIEYFEGKKPWEIRFNDRNFKVGDLINFTIIETGQMYQREITHVYSDVRYGLSPGYCILTLSGYNYCL